MEDIPATYPPHVPESELGSPTSSVSDRQIQNLAEASNTKRGTRLPRSQSRLFKKSDNGRGSTVPPQSTSHSRHSSRSISALLLLSNERLNNATNRVTSLESDREELLKRFGSLYKEKLELQNELYSTQESLRLHKFQLELAQKEIDRANELLHEFDRQRTQADSNAAKLRSQVRNLEEEKQIRKGWDEGWDLGFKVGYERAQSEGSIISRFNLRRRRRRSRDQSDRGDDKTDGGDDDDTTNPEESLASPRRVRSNSTRSRGSAHSSDVVPHVPPLPIPSRTTPIQDIPSSQPQQPQMSATSTQHQTQSRGRTQSQSVSSRKASAEIRQRAVSTTNHVPQGQTNTSRRNTAPTSVRPNTETQTHSSTSSSPEIIRPISVRRPSSPAASFRSRSTVPPDGFIPVKNDGGSISLPPPHEMIAPVPPTYTTIPPAIPSSPGPVQGPRAPPPPRVRDAGDTPRHPDVSDISRASSRISHYELVSPPRNRGPLGLRVINGDRNDGEKGSGLDRPSTPSATSSSSRQAVEQWRNEIVSDPSGTHLERRTTPTATPQPESTIVSPPSTGTPVAGSSSAKRSLSRLKTPRVSIGPRRPREIVMPTPLAGASTNMLPPSRRATPPTQPLEGGVEPPPNSSSRPPTRVAAEPQTAQPAASNGGGGPMHISIAWLRSRFQRSASSPAPAIEVEPPSQSASSGTNTTVVDPVLLTPEDANRPIPLPHEVVSEATRGIRLLGSSTPIPHTPILIQLPDEDLPLGFVPMTPLVSTPPRQLHQSPRTDESRPSTPRTAAESGRFFSPIPSLRQLQDPPTPSSPPTRPTTATGLTRPPLATTPGGEQEAVRAVTTDGLSKDRRNTVSPILGGFRGWGSPSPAPSHSSFMRPPASVFGDDY
ncbi:hypothetical protein L218DRAFT_153497 [Marasmius fiardii PR-910]|nr:hypothetical protein L218DRAFT_153497 [Marasmius fiardii PR-910]